MIKHNVSYIRTTHGIYKKYEDAPDDHVYQEAYLGRFHVPSKVHVLRSSIKAESDSIYPLCDFVAIKHAYDEMPSIKNIREMEKKGERFGEGHSYLDNLRILVEMSESRAKSSDLRLDYIKFAILTDDGLKFVAEMDDKGCVEIL